MVDIVHQGLQDGLSGTQIALIAWLSVMVKTFLIHQSLTTQLASSITAIVLVMNAC
jgi:hypothetical protein